MTQWGAVRALAGHELRSRWRSVLLLGLASGIFFGGAMATIAVLIRADTAYDRMVSATHLADARVGTYNIFNDPKRQADVLAQLSLIRGSILARPDVVASQQLTAVYARRQTKDVEYLGIWAPRHQWDGLDTPDVVAGRRPADDRADEVMVNEQYAKSQGLHLGDRISVGVYRSAQVGPSVVGAPAAGHVDLLVVGVYRVADAGAGFAGLLAGPAFAARFDPTAAIGEILLLDLDRSRQSPVFGTVQSQAIALDAQMATRFGTGFYNYVDYVEPRLTPDPAIDPTRAVVRVGLGMLAVVVTVAGLVLALQLCGRWSARGRPDHGVERALGMRTREQVYARVLAAAPGIAIAATLGAVGALVGGIFEPPGALNRFEPHPGWLGQPWTAALGAIAVLLLLVALVIVTRAAVLRMERTAGELSRRRARVPQRLALAPVLRLAAALGTGRAGRGRTVRSHATILGLTGSLAMVVIVVSLATQLTRLEDSPASWGWAADFGVSGNSAALDTAMRRDARVRDADTLIDAPVHLRHGSRLLRMTAYGRARVKGRLPYRVAAGHLPRNDGEVAVGPRAADELAVGVGDRVTLIGPSGAKFQKRVAGIAVLPTLESEPLGRNLLMDQGALDVTAISRGYSNLLVRAVSAPAATALRNQLARTVEIEAPAAPSTVVALGKLAAPARLIVIVLLFGAVLLLAEYLGLLLRRRGTQLAIAASIGMTRRQLVAAMSSSTVFTALVAVLLGVPLGWAVSRVVLVEIGPRLGIELAGPGIVTAVLVALGAIALAVVLSLALSSAGLSRRGFTDLRRRESGA